MTKSAPPIARPERELPSVGAPPGGATRAQRWARLGDSARALDPGWAHIRTGAMVVAVALAVTGVEWLFVGLTHALQVSTHGARLPAAEAAEVGAANHDAIVEASLNGVAAGLLSLVALSDRRPRAIARTLLIVTALLVGGLAFGLHFDRHHLDVGLASVVVVLTASCYLRRFGAPGFAAGTALFVGVFSGLQSSAHLDLGDLGWITAEMGLGLLAAFTVLGVVFRPHPAHALANLERAYRGQARRAVDMARAAYERPSRLRSLRVDRALLRVNRTTLMIDSHLASVGTPASGRSARRIHELLFDMDLALSTIVRATADLAASRERIAISSALRSLSAGDLARAVPDPASSDGHAGRPDIERFGDATQALTDALSRLDALSAETEEDGATLVAPPPLAGSTFVSTQAAVTAPDSAGWGWARLRMSTSTRTTIQMAVAATAALFAGRALSTDRYYWAVLVVFITFMSTNNSGEQSRKAIQRTLGTTIGVLVGSSLADAVGPGHWHLSLVVLLVALFWAFALMQVNYALSVIGVTVMVTQLYLELGEYSRSLLDLRLKETLIGAGIAALTVTLVVPLRTKRVLAYSFDAYRNALTALTNYAERCLGGSPQAVDTLAERVRAVDVAYQALRSTAQPIRLTPGVARRGAPAQIIAVAATTNSDARRLAAALRQLARATTKPDQDHLSQLARADLQDIHAALGTVPAPAGAA